MIDHVMLTVADFKRSIRFYERALRPLGITDFRTSPAKMATRI
jgi:catechol 2,3-dioxygenase-like lactoylglutathione lyase family enzyme